MTEKHKGSICDWCLDYIAEALPPEEHRRFRQHLPSCPDCRRELEDIRIAWEALPADMERLEPPHDLKAHVMQAARSIGAAPEARHAAARPSRLRAYVLRTAMLAAVFILLAGTAWNYYLYRERTSPALTAEHALGLPASRLERVVSLQAMDAGKDNAYGLACIVKSGESKQFVVYVFGARANAGEETYRVWLQEDGRKTAAGDFVVDGSGIGLLAMPIAEERTAFEAVTVSLEPDRRASRSPSLPAFQSSDDGYS